jgi:hypothetical protein
MKTVVFLAMMAGATLARAAEGDDLLKNGDFSAGVAPWKGNIEISPAASTPGTTPAGGAVVKLGPAWSKVTQDFSAKEGDYALTVRYVLSPDLMFSTNPRDYGTVPRLVDLPNVGAFGSRLGQWCLILFDANSSSFWRITPTRASVGEQTFTSRVHLTPDYEQEGGTLALAFPPGNGSFHLENISLTPISN